MARTMPIHKEPHPLAGKTVLLASKDPKYDGKQFRVEDWWDRLSDTSWGDSVGNPAALQYAFHAGFHGLPGNDEVVYGKIGPFGHIVHVEEVVGLVEEPSDG